ncbi:MAG: ABC transporter substrate-binding protein [Planctomycetota bacterium]
MSRAGLASRARDLARRGSLLRATGVLLAAALGSGGCGEGPRGPRAAGPVAPTRVVTDCAGAKVTLPATVGRIVTTAPGLTALVVALGHGAALVGVSDQDPRTGALADLPRLPVYPSVPAEAVAVLEPDLVLVDRVLSGRDAEALRARFPQTFVTDASQTLDRLRETFLRVADALDRPRLGQDLAAELDDARRRHRVEGRPRVLVLGQVEPLPPYAIGPRGLLGDMVASVGGENVAWDLGLPSGPIASEVVLARRPQWILHTGGTFPDALRTAWASVPAVADGRIADVGDDDFMQGGPRTARALARLAALLGGAPSDAPRAPR